MFEDILERRDEAARKLPAALSHFSREDAFLILLSWIDIDYLEQEMVPAICKEKSNGSPIRSRSDRA